MSVRIWTLLLLVFPLIMTSCKKDEEVIKLTFRGVVVDPVANSSISDVNVVLRGQAIEGGVWSSAYTTLGSTTTDGSGSFSFTYDKANYVEYRLEVNKANHFNNEFTINGDDVLPDAPYNGSFDLYKQAWFKVQLVNANPVNDQDEVRYQKVSDNLGCAACCTNDLVILGGQSVDTSWICPIYGGSTVEYNWFITKNSSTWSNSDSVLCPAFDTTSVLINY